MIVVHGISQRQACKTMQFPRTSFQYKPRPKNDAEVIEQLEQQVEKHPGIGFWKSYQRIKRKGFTWNHKRVYRVCTQLRLNIRRRAKKRLPARVKQALFTPETINQV